MYEVIMPKLGLTMETGTIIKWLKKEGDSVETGDVLFEVMTDKVSLEVEAYNSGILRKILRTEGQEVPVTEVIAFIGQPDEVVPEISQVKANVQAPVAEEVMQPQATSTQEPKIEVSSTNEERIKISPLAKNIAEVKGIDLSKVTGTGPGGRIVKEDVEAFVKNMEGPGPKTAERIKISPLAKNIAKEMGIDYSQIKGTGPEGRIVKEDVTSYAESVKIKGPEVKLGLGAGTTQAPAASAFKPSGEIRIKSQVPLKGIRKVIADRMTYSKQNIPHIILTSVPDVNQLIMLRERLKDKVSKIYEVKITVSDFILKACAMVLAEQPVVNASLQEGSHILYEDINIGMAVSVEGGLIVPTIYNCDKLSILEIARKRTELVEKARQSKLTLDEISNATFTVSNLGMFGIRSFTAIINPPQGAIFTVGGIYTAPAFVNGKIEQKSYMDVSIAVDHRIIDGADGAKFLQRFVELVENPELLVI
jgi:pyruvate dehydrogenase E2 component (dihydrolipoamide acetyltransferase)